MTAGIAASLAVLLLSAYVVLRGRAEVIWRDRLTHSVQEIARSIDASIAQLRTGLRATARDEAVRRALLAGQQPAVTTADINAARAALARLTTPSDTTHPVELWDMRGRRIAVAGPEFPIGDRFARIITELESNRDATSDSVRFSPLEAIGNRVRFWAVAPVVANGARVGFIVQPRYVSGQREQLRMLREFIREDVGLYLRNADGSVWVTAPDAPTPPPLQRDSSQAGIVNVRSGVGRMFAQEAMIGGTPWVAGLEASEESIMGPRVYRTLRLLAALSALVVLVGALLSWFVGRRLTRPLLELTAAAESVSRGTYDRAVAAGRDEIGRLAASFDDMARQVATARHELEQRANEADAARREAEEANRSKSAFLAMMSHELRTPLNAIGGYTQLMEMGIHGEMNDEQRAALGRITRNQAHLLALISDLLSFARIDAGRVTYDIEDLSLHETLASLESLVAPQLASRKLLYVYRSCATDLTVRADKDRLCQILLNLVGNAIKYTPDGGSVTITCDFDHNNVHIHVRDTGRGIPADRLSQIFEPFVQGERALNRPTEGVGLGLAISRDLATAMSGQLGVSSRVGHGSTFTLTLPRADAVVAGRTSETFAQSGNPVRI